MTGLVILKLRPVSRARVSRRSERAGGGEGRLRATRGPGRGALQFGFGRALVGEGGGVVGKDA